MTRTRIPTRKRTKLRRPTIPIPRAVMAYFRKMAGGNKSALAQYLRGYRKAFRVRIAAGESPARVHASVKAWFLNQGWN